jgi:hypothetical protein
VTDDNSNPAIYFVHFDRNGVLVLCEEESVNRSQNGSKTDVINRFSMCITR